MIRALFDSLTIRLTMLLIVALGSIAGAAGLFWLALSDTEDMPELLDKLGRQRMLSMQIVASAQEIDGEDHEEHRRLMESADDFDATIQRLRDYEDQRRLDSGRYDELLEEKVELWEVLRGDIDVLVGGDPTAVERRAARERLIEEGPLLAQRADAIVQELRSDAERIGDSMSWVMVMVVSVNLLIVVLGYIFVRRWIVDPLGRLKRAAQDIQGGDLSVQIEERHGGEVGTLETTFNAMAGEIEHLVDSLDEQRQLAEAFVNYAPAGVVIYRGSTILLTNPEFESMNGGKEPGDIDELVELFVDCQRSEVRDVLMPEIACGEVSKTDHPLQLRGQDRSVEVVTVPIEYGGRRAWMVVIRDVTEQQRFLARMIQIDRVMATGSLASGIGHEINNPLSFVFPNIEFAKRRLHALQSQWDDNGQRLMDDDRRQLESVEEALDEGLEGAERIRDIVERLRTFATHERSGKRARIDIRTPLDAAVQMVRGKIRDRAALQVDFVDDVPSVEADASKLAQVFVNLLLNAVDSIEPGDAGNNEIGVELRCCGDKVVVEIRDTGAGIDPEVAERIFDPFFTTKSPGQGTGLGLASCQAIVEDHGGMITFDSDVGQGTVFCVELPIADVSAMP